jgi:hypothetical protein
MAKGDFPELYAYVGVSRKGSMRELCGMKAGIPEYRGEVRLLSVRSGI